MKLKNILFANENTGDFSGAGTFQGGPYGFGNRYQLANSQVWPGLQDPDADLPPNPSFRPAIDAQRDPKDSEYESLESSEVYDSRPHLLPGEDTVRDEILDREKDLEPSYFYNPEYQDFVNERDAAAILYRDMPGFPAMNTLSDPVEHVPEDEDLDREEPEEERYNIPHLLPSPREGERGIPFGHGPVNTPGEGMLTLEPGDIGVQASMYSPTEPEGNELNLTKKRNQTLNRWKETTQVDKGHTNRDEVFNHLVKPVDWIKKEFGQQDYVKDLDSDDDVPIHAGSQGVVAHPVKHVPGNVNIYKKGNPGYSLGEAKEPKTMAKKETKRELEDYVPKDLDKKMPDETYGNGMGQIMKAYPFPREDRELKKHKPLEPEQSYVPYSYDRSHIDIIIVTKLFEKLAKLAKSEKK
jgi:hypothetical protein